MISRNPVPRAGQTAAGGAPAAPRDPHNLFLAALPFAVVIAVAVIDVLAGPDVGFLPVLSLGPALAAISRRPLSTALIGMLALGLGVLLAVYDNLAGSRRGVIALIAIAGVTAAGVVASAGRQRRERELANFKTIAEAAQQILLRPVPGRIPPVDIAVRYVSAAASARIGGDLYEVIAAGSGIRLIVGDVLGKGLPAARTASVVLGAFREAAYDALGLAQIAARIEASLQHQEAEEEFVTAVLAQVDADGSRVEILNCGHPPPLLVRDGAVTLAEPPEAGLPLGLRPCARRTGRCASSRSRTETGCSSTPTGSARRETSTGPSTPSSGPGRFSGCRTWAPHLTGSSKTSWRTSVTRSWMTPRCC